MNRGQIVSLAANFAEDPDQTRYAGKYNDAADRAQEQFAMDSKALFKDTTITIVSGTAAYDLPTDFMWEKKVTHMGLRVDPITRHELELYRRSDRWDDDQGTPRYYMIDPEEASKKITLFPIPQGEDAGANLVMTYYPLPAAMSSDSAVPLNSSSLMAQFHIGIAALTAWILLSYDQSTPEKETKKTGMMSLYTAKVDEAIMTFGNTKSAPLRIKPSRVWI